MVEDEYFLADDIARTLRELGASVIGPVGELGEAVRLLDGDGAIDAAIVDINLHSDMIYPLARKLRSRNVPLLFTTGYDRKSIEPEFQDVPLWEKPLDLPAMARNLTGLINGA